MTANNEEVVQKIVSGLRKFKWPRAYEDCQVTLSKAEDIIREAIRSQAGAVTENWTAKMHRAGVDAVKRAIKDWDCSADGGANLAAVDIVHAVLLAAPASPEAYERVLTEAASDVLAERRRQISKEGWTPEHDDKHANGSLALAAACYAMFASESDSARVATDISGGLTKDGKTLRGWAAFLTIWPWDRKWWKPTDRRRDLVKAGALILADIERLDRAALATRKADGNGGEG